MVPEVVFALVSKLLLASNRESAPYGMDLAFAVCLIPIIPGGWREVFPAR